jgi:hypothetical protein
MNDYRPNMTRKNGKSDNMYIRFINVGGSFDEENGLTVGLETR